LWISRKNPGARGSHLKGKGRISLFLCWQLMMLVHTRESDMEVNQWRSCCWTEAPAAWIYQRARIQKGHKINACKVGWRCKWPPGA
jgi:hypothetical protein